MKNTQAPSEHLDSETSKQLHEFTSAEMIEKSPKLVESINNDDANSIFRDRWQTLSEESFLELKKANPIEESSFDDETYFNQGTPFSNCLTSNHSMLNDIEESRDDENSYVSSSLASKNQVLDNSDYEIYKKMSSGMSSAMEDVASYDAFYDSSNHSIKVDCYISFSSEPGNNRNGVQILSNSRESSVEGNRSKLVFQDRSCRLFRGE